MMKNNDIHNYNDIINRERHISKRHAQMARKDRAIQFAPFAALTGHKEAVLETGRQVDTKKILDENQKVILNQRLQDILLSIKRQPQVEIIYFQRDDRKEGGSYMSII